MSRPQQDSAESASSQQQYQGSSDKVSPHRSNERATAPLEASESMDDVTQKHESECRICLLPGTEALICPCHCCGSVQYVHSDCLYKWACERRSVTCELCNNEYIEPYKSEIEAAIAANPAPPRRWRYIYRQPEEVSTGTTGTAFWKSGLLNFWCHALAFIILAAGIMYLALYSNIATQSPPKWTVMICKIVIIVIPAYFIGRALIVAFIYWRRARQTHYRPSSLVLVTVHGEGPRPVIMLPPPQQQQQLGLPFMPSVQQTV